ncbi:MAG: Crp/Fnr family transcriptional regulator [Pseudobdellovibrionaceae bacterium]
MQNSFVKTFENGHILVQQGDKPEHLIFIISGTVKTLRADDEGKEAVIRLLQAGETCMEAVLFMGDASPITVQTISESKVLLIPEKLIKSLTMQNAQFANNILHTVTHYYKNAMQQIDAMQIKSPLQRIGYYFLLKHLEHGSDDFEFSIPFKKSIIANYLGMTPETFSRCLQKMKALGVETDDDIIRMKDAFSLCHFCDTDTEALCRRHNKDDCPHCPVSRPKT